VFNRLTLAIAARLALLPAEQTRPTACTTSPTRTWKPPTRSSSRRSAPLLVLGPAYIIFRLDPPLVGITSSL
jgi:hypothetical protein